MTRHSVGWLVGLAVGAAVSVASAAQAEPARLTDQDMDVVTAGGLDDLVTLTFEPVVFETPAVDRAPGNAFSKVESHVFESHGNGGRTVVVTSYSIFVEN